MSKIRIANWLLTRKCNLICSYCAITKNYLNMPPEYPKMKHYIKNEMSTQYVINGLKNLKLHNPDCFHILYGGEPLLRPDLPEIINYCNKEDIHYTVITNNSDEVQPMIEILLDKTDYISGLTSSVDPIIFSDQDSDDIMKKSLSGFERLSKYKGIINDLVAEITISKSNIKYLYPLVKRLSENGISSSITFIDVSKSQYYDFSNVYDRKVLVKDHQELEDQLGMIFNEKLDVHMGTDLIEETLAILPSNLNCDLDENFHNVTIDADGSIRLCLRIRGVYTPQNIKLNELILRDGRLNSKVKNLIRLDKNLYCKRCNWTCVLMSSMVDKEEIKQSKLIHSDRR